VLVAVWQPAGVELDAWALAALAFALAPRRLAWARPEPRASDWRPMKTPEWAELEVELRWNREADALGGMASWRPEAHP
jgi:hypothetical protein